MSGTPTSAYSTIYAFGGSYSDAGDIALATGGREPVSSIYGNQSYGTVLASQFSNGAVWVQDLSETLGLGQLAPSLIGGNDYAYGGATAVSQPLNTADASPLTLSVSAQLTRFAASAGHASANALFTLSVGGSDILGILANHSLTAAQQSSAVTMSVRNELSDIATMFKDGMRNIVVLNVEDLGVIPYVTSGLANGSGHASASLDTLASSLSMSYNAQLAGGLGALAKLDGFSYHIADLYGFMANAYSNPSAYGYTNVTTPVWNGNFTNAGSGTLSSANTTVQNQSMFFDNFHLTASGAADVANIADAAINPTYVYQSDLMTGKNTTVLAGAYAGQDTALHTQYITVTPDNVGLFASTPGMFLQTGAGNNVLAAQSGANVLTTSGGSSFFEGGTGTDTFDVHASASTSSWNTLQNFHAGDVLSVIGYQPGVSKVLWTSSATTGGAVLNVDVAGTGHIWSSDTFAGITLSTAQHFATSVTSIGGVQAYTVAA